MFSERGYHGASMAEMADAVGHAQGEPLPPRAQEGGPPLRDPRAADRRADRARPIGGRIAPRGTRRRRCAAVLRVTMRFIARNRDGGHGLPPRAPGAVTGERWAALVVKRDLYEQHGQRGSSPTGVRHGRASWTLPPDIAARGVLGDGQLGLHLVPPGRPPRADEVADVFAAIALRGPRAALRSRRAPRSRRARRAGRPCGPCRSTSSAARRRSATTVGTLKFDRRAARSSSTISSSVRPAARGADDDGGDGLVADRVRHADDRGLGDPRVLERAPHSTSMADTFSPARLIMSFLRSKKYR